MGSGVQLCGPEQVFLFLCDLLSLSAFLTIAPTSLGLCWSLTSLFSDPLLTIPLKHISCLPAVFSPWETLARDWRAREGPSPCWVASVCGLSFSWSLWLLSSGKTSSSLCPPNLHPRRWGRVFAFLLLFGLSCHCLFGDAAFRVLL